MTAPDPMSELATEIRKLGERLDAPKRKDWWERLPVLSGFISSVLIAVAGLYFTQAAQRTQAIRQQEFQQAQIEVQQAQMRIEELKALTSVAPLLASHDSAERAVAFAILDAVKGHGGPAQRSSGTGNSAAPGGTSMIELSLLDSFIDQARDARASDVRRITALRQMGAVASSSSAPAERTRALGVARAIAGTPGVSELVRRTASDVAAGLRRTEFASVASPPPAPPPPPSSSSDDTASAQVARLVNEHRRRVGCPALRWDAAAARIAQSHIENLSLISPFVDLSMAEPDIGERLRRAGVTWRWVAENLAADQPASAGAVRAWTDRPGQRAAMENCRYTHMGVGHVGFLWTLVLYTPL